MFHTPHVAAAPAAASLPEHTLRAG
jgi:hypothetical protein